jgi:hypothetical protein
MIDFREFMIIDKSQDYENLIEKNNVLEKKNYFLGIIVTTLIITVILAYNEAKESKKRCIFYKN